MRMGYLIGARGYVMIGIGGFLVGFMFFLFGCRIYLVAVIIGIIGFLIAQVGFGFILTTEKSIDRMLKKNTNFIQRIFGRIPDKVVEEITQYHEDIAEGNKARDGRGRCSSAYFQL
jgi:xanthosine utilization system XapX-like protein